MREHTDGIPLAVGVLAFGAGCWSPPCFRRPNVSGVWAGRATDVAAPLVEHVGHVVSEVRDQLGQRVEDAVESVRSAAGEAGQAVTAETRAATASVRDRARGAIDGVEPDTIGHR